MKIMSSFTNPLFIPSLYDQLLQNTKENVLKNVGKSYGYPLTSFVQTKKIIIISQNIFYVPEKKEIHTGLEWNWWNDDAFSLVCELIFATQQKRLTTQTFKLKRPQKSHKSSLFRKPLIILNLWKSSHIGCEYQSYQKVGELLADMFWDFSDINWILFIWLLLIEYTQWLSHAHTYPQDFRGKDIDYLYSQLFNSCSYWLYWERV